MVSSMPESLQRQLDDLRAASASGDVERLQELDQQLRDWFAAQAVTADLPLWAQTAQSCYEECIAVLQAWRADQQRQASARLTSLRAFLRDSPWRDR